MLQELKKAIVDFEYVSTVNLRDTHNHNRLLDLYRVQTENRILFLTDRGDIDDFQSLPFDEYWTKHCMLFDDQDLSWWFDDYEVENTVKQAFVELLNNNLNTTAA